MTPLAIIALKASNMKTFLACIYCGTTLAWRWKLPFSRWHRLVDEPCPCPVAAKGKWTP